MFYVFPKTPGLWSLVEGPISKSPQMEGSSSSKSKLILLKKKIHISRLILHSGFLKIITFIFPFYISVLLARPQHSYHPTNWKTAESSKALVGSKPTPSSKSVIPLASTCLHRNKNEFAPVWLPRSFCSYPGQRQRPSSYLTRGLTSLCFPALWSPERGVRGSAPPVIKVQSQ